MKKKFFPLVATVVALTACTNQSQMGNHQKTIDSLNAIIAQDHSSEAADIIKADNEWSKVSETKSVEGWVSYYAPDAVVMPPNGTVCKDKESINKSITDMFAIPGASLTFQTSKAEVAKSGDIGYAVGVYQWSSKDPKGNDYHETGKYTEVWKKQPDGSWKVVADIWNADPPASK